MSNIEEVEDSGIFSVYWQIGKSWNRTETPNDVVNNTPDKVKLAIAQHLIDDLGIGIRLEPKEIKK